MTARTLQTDRLTLRAPAPRDARVIAKALNNFEVSKWLTVVPFPYGITDAEWFINEITRGAFSASLIWHDDTFIGTIGVDDGFGYWLAQEHWGKGYATEAGQAIIADHFATTDDEQIKASYFDGNTASCNVLTKLGFLDIGPHAHFSKARNAMVPGRMMALTRRRWQTLQNG